MKIKVGSVTYEVIEHDVILIDNEVVIGACNYDDLEISIDTSLVNEKKESVLVHELVHAILYEAGYNEHDEDFVHRFGKILHQVIKDNDLKELLKDLK